MADIPTNSMIFSDLESVQAYLKELRDKAHILTPFAKSAIPHIPQGFVVFIHQCTISTRSEKDEKGYINYTDGEVYPIKGTSKLGLSKLGLTRLEQLADVSWVNPKSDPNKPKSTIEKGPPFDNPLVCRYAAIGYMTDIDGQVRCYADAYGNDLQDNSPQAKAMSEKELPKARQNIEQLTITKAKLRVLRGLLGVKNSYTLEELQKPFVVLRLVFNIDSIDPSTKSKLLTVVAAKQLGIVNELFGLMRTEAEERRQLEAGTNLRPPEPLPPISEPLQLPGIQPLPLDNTASVRPEASALRYTDHEDPDEVMERQYWKDRDARVDRIAKLYIAKKGRTRAELSPGKPPLEELQDAELKAIEEAISQLPNIR